MQSVSVRVSAVVLARQYQYKEESVSLSAKCEEKE